ncbi:nitroreductase family protein [Thermofilum sp.]|uniref:nitroreductase family protein n=1 Tax=Thermofilum sp. TaxID=1961369 RepID=UPI003161868F
MVSTSKFEILADIVKTRRTVREYSEENVPREVIETVLDLARWSPSGSNVQDWRFVVVTNRKLLKAIKMFSPGWLGGGNPVAIVICSDKKWAYEKAGPLARDVMYLVHAGIVAQTIALLAHAMGLGTNMIMSFSKEAVKKILDLPESWDPVMIILLGYPKHIPEPPPRLALSELVVWR